MWSIRPPAPTPFSNQSTCLYYFYIKWTVNDIQEHKRMAKWWWCKMPNGGRKSPTKETLNANSTWEMMNEIPYTTLTLNVTSCIPVRSSGRVTRWRLKNQFSKLKPFRGLKETVFLERIWVASSEPFWVSMNVNGSEIVSFDWSINTSHVRQRRLPSRASHCRCLPRRKTSAATYSTAERRTWNVSCFLSGHLLSTCHSSLGIEVNAGHSMPSRLLLRLASQVYVVTHFKGHGFEKPLQCQFFCMNRLEKKRATWNGHSSGKWNDGGRVFFLHFGISYPPAEKNDSAIFGGVVFSLLSDGSNSIALRGGRGLLATLPN